MKLASPVDLGFQLTTIYELRVTLPILRYTLNMYRGIKSCIIFIAHVNHYDILCTYVLDFKKNCKKSFCVLTTFEVSKILWFPGSEIQHWYISQANGNVLSNRVIGPIFIIFANGSDGPCKYGVICRYSYLFIIIYELRVTLPWYNTLQ